MSEMILFVLILGMIGFAAGWFAREWYAKIVVDRFHDHMMEHIKEHMPKVINISINNHDGMFLVHNEETGEFLAQGTSYKELQERLNERFPDITFMASKADYLKVKPNDAV